MVIPASCASVDHHYYYDDDDNYHYHYHDNYMDIDFLIELSSWDYLGSILDEFFIENIGRDNVKREVSYRNEKFKEPILNWLSVISARGARESYWSWSSTSTREYGSPVRVCL
eukprot:8627329-Heterocapsa_arctica.AAC.1